MRKKVPIERADVNGNAEKLIEARAFIPKDCVVASIIGQREDGSRVECRVHSVQHVFFVE